jgi:hypothetical protein
VRKRAKNDRGNSRARKEGMIEAMTTCMEERYTRQEGDRKG